MTQFGKKYLTRNIFFLRVVIHIENVSKESRQYGMFQEKVELLKEKNK